MFKRILSCAVAVAVASTPVAASEYFFRFNYGLSEREPQAPVLPEEYGIGNDIQAYYVAPIGHEFSKRIPVTTRDVVLWQKDEGAWPDGLALDTVTGVMSGMPSAVEKQSVLYHGYDAAGHRIARARLSFTTFETIGSGREMNIYAHTGQYFHSEIPLPAGLDVYRWESVTDLPDGVSMLGNAIQGTPGKAGVYGVAWRGFDFMGRELAFVHGEMIVEDGPVVDTVADQSIAKDIGQTFDVLPVVQHRIGSLKFNLVAEGVRPPGLDVDVNTGRVTGTYPTFDTSAAFHFVVTDTADGTRQKSNTFRLSTLPVAADLSAFPNLSGTVRGAFRQQVTIANLQPGASFSLVSGSWPAGISMDSGTGLISGTPTRAGTVSGLVIAVSGPAMATTQSRPFEFTVHPEKIETSLVRTDIRVGVPFSTSGVTVTKGNVAPLAFGLAAGTDLSPELSLDAATGVISSNGLAQAGEHSVSLVVSNGDGQQSSSLFQEINAYNPLSLDYAAPSAKRLKQLSITPSVADKSIVGTAAYSVESGSLPDWLRLDGGTGVLSGIPTAADTVTSYAPFVIGLSDDTGEKTLSTPISITVDERDPLGASVFNSEAERHVPNQRLSLKAENAYKQARFDLVQGKLGIDPSSTLAISHDGYIVGSTIDPVGTIYGNLVVRVTDADSYKDIPFSVTVTEPQGLAPLTGSLDAVMTWTRGVPFSGFLLPELRNAYGSVVYALGNGTPGIILDPSTREVSGTISSTGTHEYTYTIDDDTDRAPASGKISLTILDPMTVSAETTYQVTMGGMVSIKPQVIDGIAPLKATFSGTLPKGLQFANGAITGTPEVLGSFGPLTITTTDAAGTSLASTFDIVVGNAADLKAAWDKGPFILNRFGYMSPTVTGAIGKLEYSLVPGSVLPEGLHFYDTGNWNSHFVGTPLVAGVFPSIAVQVTDTGYDAASTADDRTISVPVELRVHFAGPIRLEDTTMKVRAGRTFTTQALTPSNAVEPFTYTSANPGGLPYNLVLNPGTGTLTGNIDDVGLVEGIVLKVVDILGHETSASVTLEATPALEISAPAALSFRQYEDALSPIIIANPVGTVTYALSDTSPALPSGITLDAATGELKGTPDTVGTTQGYVIVATDAGDGSTAGTNPISITVLERLPLEIEAPVSISLKQHSPASGRITSANGVGAVSYSVSPALPAGLQLDADSGAISGTSAAEVPEATYTVTATDEKGGVAGTSQTTFRLGVEAREPLSLSVSTSHVFPQHFEDAIEPSADNVMGTAVWSISPALPAWASFDTASGRIHGTPETQSASQVYTLTLEDDHDTISEAITLSVGDRRPLEISSETALVGLYDRDLDLVISTTNALGELTWTLTSGTLPEGLEFDAVRGAFTGHPTEFGEFPGITVSAADEKGGTASKTFTLDVRQNGDALTISAVPERKAHVGTALSANLPVITNAIGKVTYSATGLSGTGIGIDPATGELRGTPTGSGSVTVVIKATDVTQREATATSVIEVLPGVTVTTPVEALEVVYNRDPAGLPRTVASNAVPALSWALKSGTLPTGLSINPQTGALVGRAKQLGPFGPFTVEIIDSIGGAGGRATSLPMSGRVTMNDDPIELSVSDYSTYVGSVITTASPSFDNELGKVTFFSADVAQLGLTINPSTGVISGIIDQLTDTIVNVSIRDAQTLRVTSKPLRLQVLPELRLTYPAIINATQATALSQSASIGFNIGSVSFAKGAGSWPDGVDIDPATGLISTPDVVAEAKTYGGLTVEATIVFNGGQTSTQFSNAFAIKVNPIEAVPRISNVAGNRMVFGPVGTATTAFTPVVVDSVQGKPWNYGGTVYTLNHDLAADTGLTFDAATGTISGTPTRPVIYRDLAITVTSALGDKATTLPFWFGVAPDGPITASANQKALYKWRKGQPYQTDVPLYDNWIGIPKYRLGMATSIAFDTDTGVLSTPSLPNSSSTDVPVTLTDEFGREGTFTYRIEVLDPLIVTLPATLNVLAGGEFKDVNAPVTTRLYGTATYSASGLPAWASINPSTGAISGTAPAADDGKTFTVSVTATDPYDGHRQTASYSLVVESIRYYRLLIDTWVRHASLPQCVGLAELNVMSGTTDITNLSTLTVSGAQAAYPGKNLTDGSTLIDNSWFTEGNDTSDKFVIVEPPTGKAVTSMVMYFRADGHTPCTPSTWRVQTSSDKVTWKTAWSDTLPSFRASWVTQPK